MNRIVSYYILQELFLNIDIGLISGYGCPYFVKSVPISGHDYEDTTVIKEAWKIKDLEMAICIRNELVKKHDRKRIDLIVVPVYC